MATCDATSTSCQWVTRLSPRDVSPHYVRAHVSPALVTTWQATAPRTPPSPARIGLRPRMPPSRRMFRRSTRIRRPDRSYVLRRAQVSVARSADTALQRERCVEWMSERLSKTVLDSSRQFMRGFDRAKTAQEIATHKSQLARGASVPEVSCVPARADARFGLCLSFGVVWIWKQGAHRSDHQSMRDLRTPLHGMCVCKL